MLLVPLLLIATAFSMTFLLLAFALPVVFTVYYVVRILRTRRTETPMVARRLSIPSQRERPVQSRSYWTVNPNTGDDDNA